MKHVKPTAEEVRRELGYNPHTGQLIWKLYNRKPYKDKAERPAGTVNYYGYIQIGFAGKIYPAHHLVWLWHNGEWPIRLIHKNGNRADNRIDNLEEKVQA